MKIGQKIVYFLSLAALPLGAYGCKKTVFPPQEPNIDPTELTTDTTGQIDPYIEPYVEPYDIVIQFSWDSCRIGPHWDLINYYLFDDACRSVHVIPDSIDNESVRRSTWAIPELWERVADTLKAINQRSQGKLSFDGGVFKVKQIVPDTAHSPTMDFGIYQRTAEYFRQLGITVKPEEGKPSNSRKPISGKPVKPSNISRQKLTPKVVRDKNTKNNGHYTRTVVFGWHDYKYGPTQMHFMAYIRDHKCDSVTFVPDSSIYSTINAVGGHSIDEWDEIANYFYGFKQLDPKIQYKGTVCYYTGCMSPETKALFESMGFGTVEYLGMPGLDGAKKQEAMPWNQAQEMLRSNSR